MASERKPFDWNDPNNLRERAWRSVREFFGKEEEEHPLSPETVTKEIQAAEASGDEPSDRFEEPAEDRNADRLHRRTEQRILNERPTIWPG